MPTLDEAFGKIFKNLWIFAIIGSSLIIIQSVLNFISLFAAAISIILCCIVIICIILSRYHFHGTGLISLICSYILLLNPIGFDGFGIGSLLILVGALVSTSGGFYTYTVFFFYLAIGAILLDFVFILIFI
ncbi:MAG: hypothetical protein ACTSYB_06935 [Candidatus Helarchaeota archaeon]